MRSAVVLAGGKSSRFGTPKAFVEFRKKPLIKWTLDAISPLVDEILLSLSYDANEERFTDIGGEKSIIVKDLVPNSGPLNGMLSSFIRAKGDYIALAPCDSPFLEPGLYELLFERAAGHDGAVAFINGFWEPLHGVFKRKSAVKVLKKAQASGKLRPVDAYQYLEIEKVVGEEIKVVDPRLLSFININTKEDLEKAAVTKKI